MQTKAARLRHSSGKPGGLLNSDSDVNTELNNESTSPYAQESAMRTASSDSYTQAFERAQKNSTNRNKSSSVENVTVEIEGATNTDLSLADSVNLTQDTSCDILDNSGNTPLISQCSDDTFVTDGPEGSDVFCDTDSRDMYRLEADV